MSESCHLCRVVVTTPCYSPLYVMGWRTVTVLPGPEVVSICGDCVSTVITEGTVKQTAKEEVET